MNKALRHTALATLVTLAAAGASATGNHAGGHHTDANALIGLPGVATPTTRTIHVDMADTMRFTPSEINVRQGDTVRFVIKNSGQLRHEFVIGTEKELKEHYAVMLKHPEMEHSDPNMQTLEAGKTGEIVWRFTKAGKVDFACLQPGHYDAGMKGEVKVTKRGK